VVVVGGGVWVLVDALGNIEYIAGLAHNPYALRLWEGIQSPIGRLIVLVVGIAWLAICARTPLEEDSSRNVTAATSDGPAAVTNTARASPDEKPLPDVVTASPRRRAVPVPAKTRGPREVPATGIGPDTEPNIVLLETRVREVLIDESNHGLKTTVSSGFPAATVTFRNDVARGKRCGPMYHTRAQLRYVTVGGKTIHADAGLWLDSEYSTVDFEPGATSTLVIGVQAGTLGGKSAFIMNDRRETIDSYRMPESLGVPSEHLDVFVKLIGGWEAQYVAEFHLVWRADSSFEISEA
jgi:hypothetical protein